MEDGSALIVWEHVVVRQEIRWHFVYRSSTEEGPFIQLNEEPVLARTALLTTPGMANDTVYYTVTSLSPDGKKARASSATDKGRW